MILEALCRLAEQEDLMSDPDFELKPVAWVVRVDDGGRLLGIEGTHYLPEPTGTRSPKEQVKSMRIPRQPTGRSGTKAPAAFLVDNAKYVFGRSTKDKQFRLEEGREKSGWFRDRIAACAVATSDVGVIAVLEFLDRVRSGALSLELDEKCKSNDLFAFIYAPDQDRLVHERPALREYWKAERAPSTGGEDANRRCLVTGTPMAEVPLFPLLKNVPGGSTAGVSLVGFNNPAFWSHGWRNNENAPISRAAAEAAATALNRLLHLAYPDGAGGTLPRRNFRIGADTVVCFWSSDAGAADFLDDLATLFGANDPAVVGEVYRSLRRGRPAEIGDAARFYALTITGTQGRAILRDWFESSVREVADGVARYFADLEVVRNTPAPKGKELPPRLPLDLLLVSLAPLGRRESVPAPLAAQFVTAALRGTPLPIAVLQKALERARAEIGRTEWPDLARRDARAALIKAVLRRNFQLDVEPNMDPNNHEPGYLLGRLTAVLERLQQAALGDINATVIDRYFGAASATPQAVFPRLLKNARHHARKAADDTRNGATAAWLDRQIDAILAPLGVQPNRQGAPFTGFPAHLSLEQQGFFVLGYHQQRHWLWMSREDRERWAAEYRTTPDARLEESKVQEVVYADVP